VHCLEFCWDMLSGNRDLVYPTKIAVILDLKPPTSLKQPRENLGHTRYYRKFIKGYVQIITSLEKFLNKEEKFQWKKDYHKALDTLKQKLVTMSILIFHDWTKEFHVHVDASSITLDVLLSQLGEGDIDHPIVFASNNLSKVEKNYTTTK